RDPIALLFCRDRVISHRTYFLREFVASNAGVSIKTRLLVRRSILKAYPEIAVTRNFILMGIFEQQHWDTDSIRW
ncbi:hypothetical protein, partial [Escherichia coli]|uniref:hypothetical protein n=1 Tax=Escherichia coli TaxID=562 RepID=UPI003D35BC21